MSDPGAPGIRLQPESDCLSLCDQQGAELSSVCHFLSAQVKREKVEPQNDGLFLLFARRQNFDTVSVSVSDSNVSSDTYSTKKPQKLKDMKVKIVLSLVRKHATSPSSYTTMNLDYINV